MWALSQDWYAGRLDPDFTPRTVDQSQEYFSEVGLREDFWRLT